MWPKPFFLFYQRRFKPKAPSKNNDAVTQQKGIDEPVPQKGRRHLFQFLYKLSEAHLLLLISTELKPKGPFIQEVTK
jgi:hypothetical protein